MRKIEEIVNLISEWDDSKIIDAWNSYCADKGYDDYIYPNEEETFDMFFNTIDEALRASYYGDFRYCDSYAYLNAYGNLVSFDYVNDDNSPIDINGIAEWLMEEYHDDFDIDDEDMETLKEAFLEQFHKSFPEMDIEKVETILDDNNADFLTDDWDAIANEVKESYEDED